MKKKQKKKSLLTLIYSAIGIVYGDIGTSPLYTLKECFSNQFNLYIERVAIFGFLSLIFWLLILIVSIKYLLLVMQADNSGEGGILTLMSLSKKNVKKSSVSILIIVGLIGSSFFYGEIIITPAISIISAIEGLKIISPYLENFILPLSILVLTFLFFIQKKGTYNVSKLFSPIMLIWFFSLSILGIRGVINNPEIIYALHPKWIFIFFCKYKTLFFYSLGLVVLAITGVEALYIDISHFGKLPIRIAWFSIIFPSLILNYLGQGALLLSSPKFVENPFFLLAPNFARIPLLILSMLSTIIASQAVISGVFSLTSQAIHLKYLPPMKIICTSEINTGQIYIPFINWLLYMIVIVVIIFYKHSSNLAAAYGISVTGTMILTSILFCIVARKNWNWNALIVMILLFIFLVFDIPMFLANLEKIFSGGWLPLFLGIIIFIIMNSWKNEQAKLFNYFKKNNFPIEDLVLKFKQIPLLRISGTAVFVSSSTDIIPYSLIYNIRHNKIIHERVIILIFNIDKSPFVCKEKKIKIQALSETYWKMIINYGFKETPNIEKIFSQNQIKKILYNSKEISFFIFRKSIFLRKRSWIHTLQGKIFLILYRNKFDIFHQYSIPPNQTIELGVKVEI